MTPKPRATLSLLAALALILAACDDEQAQTPDLGIDAQVTADGSTPDAPAPDQAAPDLSAPDLLVPDQLVPDQLVPDLPPPTCTDGKQNGDETDVDCGGATCPKCAVKQTCKVLTDCKSGVCTAGVCAAPKCTDKIQNGDETDVDCGGASCPACAATKKCKLAGDCASGVCTAGICQQPACTDMVLNGDETDVDCGGPTCPACAATKKCKLAGDCASGVCTAGVCAAPACTDAVLNGDETDVDCGGATCPKCAATQKCKLAGDCASGVCTAGACQQPSCTDTVQNGAETDVDCGGGACPKCAEKKACKVASDCVTGVCSGGVCHPKPGTIAKGKTIYFEDLVAAARITAISGAKLTAESAAAAGKFAPGQEVLLINMQGTATDAASVGNHELLEVDSVSGADVLLVKAPAKGYGDNKGNASLKTQKVFLVQVLRYSTLTVGGTLAARPWNGTAKGLGLVAVRATLSLEVAAGGAVTTTAAGYRSANFSCNGVSGVPGESLAPMPSTVKGQCYYNNPTNTANFGGGGGGLSSCNTYSCATQQLGAGGGGAGHGTVGTAGQANGAKHKGGAAGLLYGKTDLSQIFLGSGGGAGAGGYSGPGGGTYGGLGGGLIYLMAPTLTVKGAVTANGKKGGENSNCSSSHGSGSGGGGAGGSVRLSGKTVTITAGTVTALGAKGGCKGGGSGGSGRIRVDYSSLNGVAYPGGAGAVTSPVAYMAKY